MRAFTPLCFSLLVLFAGGCATTYRVNVDSTAKPGADAVSYVLRNATSTEDEGSLRYREAADHVRRALSGRGLYEAPPNVTADVIVSIDYGVTPRVKREIVMRPRDPDLPSSSSADADANRMSALKPSQMERMEVVTTSYEKYLHLTARENKSSDKDLVSSEIWSVDVTSEGKSKNLREYMPVLIAASIEYVGKDSEGRKSIRLKDTDADVVFVRKGM